jgi:hypothetical protein
MTIKTVPIEVALQAKVKRGRKPKDKQVVSE